MINSAKQARELIEQGKGLTRPMQIELEYAHGYLAALQGEEIKTLTDRLEILANAQQPNAMSMYVRQALDRFKEAVKE